MSAQETGTGSPTATSSSQTAAGAVQIYNNTGGDVPIAAESLMRSFAASNRYTLCNCTVADRGEIRISGTPFVMCVYPGGPIKPGARLKVDVPGVAAN